MRIKITPVRAEPQVMTIKPVDLPAYYELPREMTIKVIDVHTEPQVMTIKSTKRKA